MIHGHLDFVFYDESSLRMIVQFEGGGGLRMFMGNKETINSILTKT